MFVGFFYFEYGESSRTQLRKIGDLGGSKRKKLDSGSIKKHCRKIRTSLIYSQMIGRPKRAHNDAKLAKQVNWKSRVLHRFFCEFCQKNSGNGYISAYFSSKNKRNVWTKAYGRKALGFNGPPCMYVCACIKMNIHRRICFHDFIVTTANLNQFSTNKIQFDWNNIYKNRAHTKKQWNKQRIHIEYIHNIHIYIFIATVQIEI